jgi:transaldolase
MKCIGKQKKISSWGKNVFVKIPVMNTKGISTNEIVKKLSNDLVPLNITALMTTKQVEDTVANLNKNTPSIISVFAGRIADTGIDPVPVMKECIHIIKNHSKCQLLWASSRELLNLIQANDCGCHIITVDHGLLKKLPTIGKDLEIFSKETVEMFYNDAVKSGFTL